MGELTNKPSVLYSPCERSLVDQPLSFRSEVQVLGEKGFLHRCLNNTNAEKHKIQTRTENEAKNELYLEELCNWVVGFF